VISELQDFFCLNPTATRSEAVVHTLNKKINFEEGPQVKIHAYSNKDTFYKIAFETQ
jgi:hypothetical protein